MKTYVFGAGASAHAHYPLASNLWQSMEEWVLLDNTYRSVVDKVHEPYDDSKPFEVFLAELDDRIFHASDSCECKVLESLRNEIQYMAHDYFNSIRGNLAELYRLFAQDILTPQDAVITFNYDVSLDRELCRSGKWSVLTGYGFVIGQPTTSPSCKLLKLHGSSNWIAQLFGGLQGVGTISPDEPPLGSRPVIPDPEMIYLGTDLVDRGFRNGAHFKPSFIMPAANKIFGPHEWEDFWDSLWLQAGQAIAASDEVHIIGYSLPEYDNRARDLLLRKMSRETEVSICCRSGTNDLVKLFRDSGFTNARAAADGTFEGWLKQTHEFRDSRIQSSLSAEL
jgi:hypothetical protein